MIIDYASDLHFNHWMLWVPNQLKWEQRTRVLTRRLIKNGHGEVLVLAGDFSEWNQQALWILDEASKHYERVYFTFGNHDLYLLSRRQNKKYGDSLGRVQALIDRASEIPNVVPLVKNMDVFKGKVFAGDAMWYHLKSQEDWEFYNDRSNDSVYIKVKGHLKEKVPQKLYQNSQDWYKTLEDTPVDVFVSHVPPVRNPFSWHGSTGCYLTDVPFFNTKNWICGHEHVQGEFEEAGVTFRMNAIGYAQHYSNYPRFKNAIPDDKPDEHKLFEVKSFEI